jgi:hypothetical protein
VLRWATMPVMSSALLTVRNAGNRGNRGNVNGSPLFKAEFNDSMGLIIDKDGNVGIGTSLPSAKLSVVGSGNLAINSTGNLLVADGGTATQTAGEGGQISLGAWLNGDLSAPYPMGVIRGVSESSTTNVNGGALVFGTAATSATVLERMRIDSAGNITSTTSEAYLYFTSNYSAGSNTRAAIRTVGAGGGSGYGGDLRFSTRKPDNNWNNDAVVIDSAGRVTMPYQPMCFIRKTASQTGSGGSDIDPVTFDTVRDNVGSHYNTATNRFTAPVNGTYCISYQVMGLRNSAAYISTAVTINGSRIANVQVFKYSQPSWSSYGQTLFIILVAGDSIGVNAAQDSNAQLDNAGYFSVYLVG